MVEFDVAFSYAAEQFEIVETFKTRLEEMGLSIFVDTEYPEMFVFKYVPEVLREVYDNEKIAMLIFLSKDYVKKNFTKYEGHIALDRLITEKRVLIIKIDDTNLPWMPSSLHFFDLQKNTIDYICKAIYMAIKGGCLPDIKTVFEHINVKLQNSIILEQSLNSDSCTIFKVLNNSESYVKMNFSADEESVLIFYNSLHIDGVFPIAEIHKTENRFTLLNKGISESGDVIYEFVSENKLIEHVLSDLNIFLENLHD